MQHGWLRPIVGALLLAPFPPGSAAAQSLHRGEPLQVRRATGAIRVDGVLDDEGWKAAERVGRWYEFMPGDNVEPRVPSFGYLTYDDRFFYVAFEFLDSDPAAIRAPYTDRDQLNDSATDYGGILLDTRSDGRTGFALVVTASGVQFDAVIDDGASQNSFNPGPDFFWDAAARITDRGWTAEVRIPFSSLRYRNGDPQTWGIGLFRNWPRDFRHMISSAPIPRGTNCTVCTINPLVGLEGLPSQNHVVAAPYLSATSIARPNDGPGSPLTGGRARPDAGVDVKWSPFADTAFDFAVNPDFSQIEADVAQITANEQFALSYPEKRPFFLEGVELLATPIRAVYTRSITDPRWGARATGKAGGISYTAFVTEDAGGGSVVIPGPLSSSLEPQDGSSMVMMARARRDLGRSFVSVLATTREAGRQRGYNRLVGPDFHWRYSTSQMLTGQWLFSDTSTPVRLKPDTASAGRDSVASHAGDLEWRHNSTHLDLSSRYRDVGDGFRADAGFVPQVGYREGFGRAGWTVRPTGFVRELRTFVTATEQADRSGALIMRAITPTVAMNVRWNGFMQFRLIEDRVRSRDQLFDRRQVGFFARFTPSPMVAQLSLDGAVGTNVDFAESRPARGGTINVNATLNLTRRLSVALVQNQRWLRVQDLTGASQRLLLASVSRVRGNYMFTANSFVRIIAQYTSTTRNPALFQSRVREHSGVFSGSALFAYKINWQSVLFIGYGDDRELSADHQLERTSRQFFAKVSYAFQR
jgi:hypothetical protein